jgi:murein DD-endopeptidase MepM/ murein hydrolase activator NlpD
LICLVLYSNASTLETKYWDKNEVLLTFIKKYHLPRYIYFNLSTMDKELCTEIKTGSKYFILKDNNIIQHILIPISEEMQIHIYKVKSRYNLDIIPIEFSQFDQIISIKIKNSPYEDILEKTHNIFLTQELLRVFKKNIPFKRMLKGNHIVINFTQRVRMGEYFGIPKIKSAMVEVQQRKYYIFKNQKDEQYYNQRAKSITSFFLKIPLKYRRVSSRFTYKRYHPILKKYKAHLGIDYAAPTGRKIYAAADGKIIYRNRKGGYGKTIIIRHQHGYKTLYAHQYKFARGLRIGSYVKQGRLIGYVGNTGRSTGPHLHFGLYKNGRAINPNKIITVTKRVLRGKAKKEFLKYVKIQQNLLLDAITNEKPALNLRKFDKSYLIHIPKKI